MATAVTAGTSYLIGTARTQIQARFRQAHEYLTREEAKLLRELEAIQDDYEAGNNSRFRLCSFQSMEMLQSQMNLDDNDRINLALAEINRKMDEILTLPQPANLSPAIPQPIISIPDYKNNSMPVIACCKTGTAPGELNSPYGLAIEPLSGRIYIADEYNNRVQVFTPNGEYLFMFGGNMNRPWGICINNDTVYVSQLRGDCITSYMLDGTYINKIGSYGTMNGQFKCPTGLAVSPATGLLYVCDCSNNRVQVFYKELKFHSLFAENTVYFPHDVKLTHHLVIVLDRGDPCIHLFDITDLSLLRSIISKGVNKQIYIPLFFTVDRELNILLTDYTKHCVCVFSQSGELITQFGKAGHSVREFYHPTGIAIDNQNRIVVVSQNKNYALQLFLL